MWEFIKDSWGWLLLVILCCAGVVLGGVAGHDRSVVVNTAESYELLVTWQEDGVQREARIRLVPIKKEAK